jgi:glucose/arabinose dehydrogenase
MCQKMMTKTQQLCFSKYRNASGFGDKSQIMSAPEAAARADGVAEAPDGSLFITDSQKGKVWHVVYQK